MESYKKQLIQRFWEERRLTHPHISLLYDVVCEVVKGTDYSAKEEDLKRLQAMKQITINSVSYEMDYIDTLYHRNQQERLDIDLDTNKGFINVAKLELAVKAYIRDLTVLLSRVAQYYYLDIQWENDRAEEKVFGRF